MEIQEPNRDTYFEMEFESPLASQIHQMRSEILEKEPTLDVITSMQTKDVLLLYLQRLAQNPGRPMISAKMMVEAREAHILIYNLVEELSLTINEEKEWVVNFIFTDALFGIPEDTEVGRNLEPPTQEEGYKVFNFFRNLTKSHFYNREAVRMAVEFYFIIHSAEFQHVLKEYDRSTKEDKPKKAKDKKSPISGTITVPATTKFRRGSLFMEGSFPKAQKKITRSDQLSIFSNLDEDQRREIQASPGLGEVDDAEAWLVKRHGQRIVLTMAEHKLIICISQILQEVSRNTENADEEDYYAGNADPNQYFKKDDPGTDLQYLTKTLKDGQIIKKRSPTIAIPLNKLAQVYVGRHRKPGKSEKKLLMELAFRFQTDIRRQVFVAEETETETDYYFEPLMRVVYRKPKTPPGAAGILILRLHPIFIDQIEDKFGEYPEGYLDMIYAANEGNQRLSDIVLPFLDYLIHLRANRLNPHYNPKIGVTNLYYKLARHWLEDKKQKRGVKYVKERVDEAIVIAKKIGLLNKLPEDPETTRGKSGEPMYHWDINFNWC